MKNKLKAQIKFDFILGFFLFLLAVSYISYSSLQLFPKYAAQSSDNDLKLESWRASEEFMRFSEKNGVIDESSLNLFRPCVRYNYNDAGSRAAYANVTNRLNISDLSSVHLTFDMLLFGITNTGNNIRRDGNVIFLKNQYPISVRNTSTYFNQVSTDGGASWSTTAVNVGVPPETFEILKVDYDGEFTLLRKRLFDCGPNVPSLAPNSVVRRYALYNGSVAMMELTYW